MYFVFFSYLSMIFLLAGCGNPVGAIFQATSTVVDPNYHPGLLSPALVTSIIPSLGSVSGNTEIEIDGHLFQSSVKVSLDGYPCTPLTFLSSTRLRCFTAAHAAGMVDVVLTSSDGQVTTTIQGFTYIDNPTPGGGSAITVGGGTFSSGVGYGLRGAVGETAGAVPSTSSDAVLISGETAVSDSP